MEAVHGPHPNVCGYMLTVGSAHVLPASLPPSPLPLPSVSLKPVPRQKTIGWVGEIE